MSEDWPYKQIAIPFCRREDVSQEVWDLLLKQPSVIVESDHPVVINQLRIENLWGGVK